MASPDDEVASKTDDSEPSVEADDYEVLSGADVDDDPSAYRPLTTGDVFTDVALDHLGDPFAGPVIVIGHPCSLRRGLQLQADIPVAPITEPGLPTAQHATAERLFPVGKLLPPGSGTNRVVALIRSTTVPAERLLTTSRSAALTTAGIVALQQRVVGNLTRVKVAPGVLARHMRGPLIELELWTDWREGCADAGLPGDSLDADFDQLMRAPSGFGQLSWREALGEHEHARGRAVSVMDKQLAAALGG